MISDILSKIIQYLQPDFQTYGYKYRKKDSEFYLKDKLNNTRALTVDVISTSDPDRFMIVLELKIRINELEEVYIKHNPYISSQDKKKHYTLNVNKSGLLSESFTVDEVQIISEKIWSIVNSEIMPFLEKYSIKSNLIENLKSEDYNEWITSDRLTRYPVLLSYAALENDKANFAKYSKEFIEFCKQPFSKVHQPMANSIINGIAQEYFEK